MYYCVAIPWQVVEWEEARKKCNDECRLSVSILVAMNCLSAMHRNLGRMRAANRVMDAALALHKETFLKQPGSTAGESGGLLHALGPVFESSSSSFLRQFERSLTEDFKEDILIGLVYSPWRGMERQQVALSPKSVESERFPVLGRPGPYSYYCFRVTQVEATTTTVLTYFSPTDLDLSSPPFSTAWRARHEIAESHASLTRHIDITSAPPDRGMACTMLTGHSSLGGMSFTTLPIFSCHTDTSCFTSSLARERFKDKVIPLSGD